MMKLLVAPSESVGWNYIDNQRKLGDASKIHIVFDAHPEITKCYRGSYYMDAPRKMSLEDFLSHDARCLLCCKTVPNHA